MSNAHQHQMLLAAVHSGCADMGSMHTGRHTAPALTAPGLRTLRPNDQRNLSATCCFSDHALGRIRPSLRLPVKFRVGVGGKFMTPLRIRKIILLRLDSRRHTVRGEEET